MVSFLPILKNWKFKKKLLGISSENLAAAMENQCKEFTDGDFDFAEQMRHWSPSTSPLPTDENHFSSPSSKNRVEAVKNAPVEAPNSPRSFFSRLLQSNNSSPSMVSRLVSPSGKNSARNSTDMMTTPVKRTSNSTVQNGENGRTSLEATQRNGHYTGSSDKLTLFAKSMVLYNATLLELAAISTSASRRYL